MAKKILVIDDDPDIQKILSLILTDEGYHLNWGANAYIRKPFTIEDLSDQVKLYKYLILCSLTRVTAVQLNELI